jgi:hypothetical protein
MPEPAVDDAPPEPVAGVAPLLEETAGFTSGVLDIDENVDRTVGTPTDVWPSEPSVDPIVVVGVPIVPVPMMDVDWPGCTPIVGNVGVPMVGSVGVPMVGSVGVPMAGSVGVPMVGNVGVPMAGISDVPMVGSVVPIDGSVEAPAPNVGEMAFMPGATAA